MDCGATSITVRVSPGAAFTDSTPAECCGTDPFGGEDIAAALSYCTADIVVAGTDGGRKRGAQDTSAVGSLAADTNGAGAGASAAFCATASEESGGGENCMALEIPFFETPVVVVVVVVLSVP